MRKNFAQILKENKIDIKNEYTKLFGILYSSGKDSNGRKMPSVYDIFSGFFVNMWFRGTALSLEEFDKQNGFDFEEQPQNFDIEYLVSFCEYFINLALGYKGCRSIFDNTININGIIEQIRRVTDAIGYMQSQKDGFTIFVEKSPAAIAVAEIVDDELSYKVIAYNHHSLIGNLPEKQNILLKFAEKLEPKRKQIETFNKSLSDDLFYCFNNLNIRHNNIDKFGGCYHEAVARMSKQELEKWYDDIYQMSLLAFLCFEQKDIKDNVKKLKQTINPPKTV